MHHATLGTSYHREWASVSKELPWKGSFKVTERANKSQDLEAGLSHSKSCAFNWHPVTQERAIAEIEFLLGQHIIPPNLLQVSCSQPHTPARSPGQHLFFRNAPEGLSHGDNCPLVIKVGSGLESQLESTAGLYFWGNKKHGCTYIDIFISLDARELVLFLACLYILIVK